ncbi:hypothetical protein BYT27DRAFT_7210993 [Phlegmacium glaucopus]|nr:hypothetical protein BYT27DRAFT_7210993 [Phlegmacium glaucopus]
MYVEIQVPTQFPPESAVDTDSDGACLGLSKLEDEDNDVYKPPGHVSEDDEEEGDASDESMVQAVQLHRNRQRKNRGKKKEKGNLQAEVHAHHQEAPTVYGCPDQRLLDVEKGEQRIKTKSTGKAVALGGLHCNWKQLLSLNGHLLLGQLQCRLSQASRGS